MANDSLDAFAKEMLPRIVCSHRILQANSKRKDNGDYDAISLDEVASTIASMAEEKFCNNLIKIIDERLLTANDDWQPRITALGRAFHAIADYIEYPNSEVIASICRGTSIPQMAQYLVNSLVLESTSPKFASLRVASISRAFADHSHNIVIVKIADDARTKEEIFNETNEGKVKAAKALMEYFSKLSALVTEMKNS